jgi:sigma-B regulation protein RsbU (phosphoserine phosphatase)
MPRSSRWRWLIPAAAVTGVTLADALTGESAVLLGLLAAAPLLSAALLDRRHTGWFAVTAVALAIPLGQVDGIFGTSDHFVRLTILVVVGGIAVWIATVREQREQALLRLARVAEVAQRAIMRPVPEAVGEVRLASRYISSSRGALVGGDLMEVVDSPSGVRAMVGDVRGKGLEAVEVAANVLGAFRATAYGAPTLVDVARQLDDVCSRGGDEDFVTAVFVEFHTDGSLGVLNAGHHPPIRVGRCGDAELLASAASDRPLGLDPKLEETRYDLDDGDRLLLYTDGLVECRDTGGRFFPLLDRAALALRNGDLDEAVENLLARLAHHCGGKLRDDIAVVLAERVHGGGARYR